MNFQAAVTAIASVYMARGRPLLWLDRLVDDTPIAVDAETGGAGDDVRLLLKDTRTVEIQVKKGLRAGNELWDSLLKLASAVTKGASDFGVLIASPTSSNTITNDLAKDIVRIGNGRTDGLSRIGTEFLSKLAAAGISSRNACTYLRIHKVPALEADQAAVLAARAELAHICADETQIGAAWTTLLADAAVLIEQRGRRDVAAVLQLLAAAGIELAASIDHAPVQLLAKLARWTLDTHATFSIFGIDSPLNIDESWLPLTAIIYDPFATEDADLEEALRRYQAWETRSAPRDARSVNPETLARFVTRTVLVAGPGMGKTTLLKRIARRYSEDSIPVLHVRLSAVATRMQAGATFEEAVFHLGLDGSGITVAEAQNARFLNWTLLCDGLDECGARQEDVAAGVARFAAGHPHSRILVTTRPIGYRATHFKEWRHYELAALDTTHAQAHAAQLLEAVTPPESDLHESAWDICRREFEDRPAEKIVGRTPLLLGLAVAVIVRGKSLGATRGRLFEQIFDLIDEVPNARIPEPPAPAVMLRRFLDILGWQITAQPLGSVKDALVNCAAYLAADTGVTAVAAAANAERYLGYWQDIGMIERVGQDGRQTLAFIHKSFGEFAAARYLRALPLADQVKAVAKRIDESAWAEVLRLAGLLGMPDIVATQLIETSGEASATKRIALAAELVAEADPPPSPGLRGEVIDRAFAIAIDERRRQAFDVGMPLVSAARRFPDEVGPTASRHLDAEWPWAQLISWACGIASGPRYYALNALIEALPNLVDAIGPGIEPSLGGGVMLTSDNGRDIAEAFVLDACGEIIDRAPSKIADALVPGILNHRNLGSLGFVSRATKLVQAKGQNYQIGRREWFSQSLFDVPDGYFDAQRTMYEALFDALDLPEAQPGCDAPVPRVLLHFSAFIESSQMLDVPARDVWAWSRPFDRDAVRATLRGIITATGVDGNKLREDAVHARCYLNSEAAAKDRHLFHLTTNVDPPRIDWTRAKTLDVDVGLVETAVTHPSRWIKWGAANLLIALLDLGALEEAARRLLHSGRGLTLWVAAGLVAELDHDRALALLLDRLVDPLVPGCEHLFDLLRKLTPPWSPELESAIRAGLVATDVDTAVAAAKLVADICGPSFPQLEPMIEQAHAHWLVHEEPYPTQGGVVPTSPRATLVDALHKIRPPSYVDIKGYLADARSDVREIGATALVERLRQPDGERLQFFSDIQKGDVASQVLGKVLKENLLLAQDELAAAEALLASNDGNVRYSAMALLTDQYLDRDQIRDYAGTMTRDSEQQIKDRAFAILDSH